MVRATAVVLSLLLLTNPHTLAKGHFHVPNTSIQAHKPHEVVNIVHTPPKYQLMEANISCYTSDSDECEKSDGITASGTKAVAGRTIAMDGVPFGTKVIIDGHVYVVEDRFGGGYKNRIDIYCNSKEEAFRFGRQFKTVKILEE